MTLRPIAIGPPRADGLSWSAQPRALQMYVAAIIAVGASGLVWFFPLAYPRPLLFASLLVLACLTSIWKVNLPISLASGSTLSVSYAADLMALLLLGPRHAVVIAVAGVWTQCTWKAKRSYPLYRTSYSAAAEAITMVATGLTYTWLGGRPGPLDFSQLAKPLVGAIATYFFVNTGLVAGAIALSTGRTFGRVWREDFLWSGASFMVAGTAGAVAAIVIDRGDQWKAMLLLAPIYLTYRSYQLFVRRLDQMTRFEEARNHLLEGEQAARASAEQANRLKDQFLATVSHELRTPLNAILGWAEMLRSGKLDAQRRTRAVQAIYDGAKRQARLVDELLDVARIMSGKLQLERGAVNMQDILRGALELVQPVADKKGIHIALDADSSIGPLYADGTRLQQVVWNLLTNAVKFTPDAGAVRVRLRRSGNFVELTVTDTGQGISPDFLPAVFEPFRQADGSTTRSHGGLGLGLSIVKHLVEAHGGTVRAESGGPGQGATFRVRLPIVTLYDKQPSAISDGSTSHDEEVASLRGLSVLVVDDDDESREVVAAHLENQRALVFTAASAEQALALLRWQHIDVLLADVAMPGEDGYTLIRKLRAMPNAASIPAAALTAFARDEDRRQALRAGFHLHLAKPVEARSLVEAVASLGRLNQAQSV